ncbi:MAG: cytochrome P450 [Actinomycetales bacterium]|nr:cytochrome P450 [Actinomycetales bacterium]
MTKTPTHYFRTPVTAPGPLGQTMVRSMGAIRRNPLSYLNEVWRQHGDVVQFPIPRPPTYLVNSPEGVRRVLVDNARNYGKSTIQYRALSLVTGDGLLTSDGPTWRAQRRVLQPAFHHDALADLGSHVAEATARIAREWQGIDERTVIDADAFMMNAALEVVAGSLMSTDLTGQSAEIAAATLEALDVVIARARVPLTPPSWLPTPANRVLKRSVARLDAAVSTMMSARSSDPGADLLGLLLSVRDENDQPLSVEEIRDQLVTFIVAGHETVASALGWAWGLLAEHPAVADAVASEAEAVAPARAIAYSDFPHLMYSRAVVEETLRLYPPAWLITRSAGSSDRIDGVEIPAGALVIMSPWLLHRHPDLWDNPDVFDPSRFASDVPRFTHIPFGAGPRLCIGRDFSYVEAVMVISELGRRFRVEFPEGLSLPPGEPLVTIRPRGGMPLHLHPR